MEQGFLHAETISNILRARTKKQFFWLIEKRRSKSKFLNIGSIYVLKREIMYLKSNKKLLNLSIEYFKNPQNQINNN